MVEFKAIRDSPGEVRIYMSTELSRGLGLGKMEEILPV